MFLYFRGKLQYIEEEFQSHDSVKYPDNVIELKVDHFYHIEDALVDWITKSIVYHLREDLLVLYPYADGW